MKYVCDAPAGRTWFRIETEGEAARESIEMQHAVEKHFQREKEMAAQSYKPPSSVNFEQLIALKSHLEKTMPHFLTLRDREGTPLATAMLPPGGRDRSGARVIIVGRGNADPYPEHADAIAALGRHYKITLDRGRCYPYARG
jgi:hypothetical protein